MCDGCWIQKKVFMSINYDDPTTKQTRKGTYQAKRDTESLLYIIGKRSSDSGKGGAEKHLGLGTS
jgi:hypothetical protein